MIIYYDPSEQSWFHTQANEQFTLGMDTKPLPYKNTPSKNAIPFHVTRRNNGNLGPLVGILTSRSKNSFIAGNKPLFRMLQKEILDNGGISVVITLENIERDKIKGFVYLPFQKKWIKVMIPYPHIFYNRIPSRKIEQSEQFKNSVAKIKEKGIVFFNPSFLNKYEVYELLSHDPHLKKFIPETMVVKERELLRKFLYLHNHIYLKPSNSAKGNGMFRVFKGDGGFIYSQDFKNTVKYPDFNIFWSVHKELLQETEYVAQKEISPLLYNGNRYDFRILAHFNGKEYIVTGIGIRQSEKQNLTTHIPHGGKLIDLEEVYREKDEKFIYEIVKLCGELLSKRIGFFGEFSIDAGITNEEEYVIYEINSKPMSFDEDEIERQRITNLILLFKHIFKEM